MKFKILSDVEVEKLYRQSSEKYKAEADEFLIDNKVEKNRADYNSLRDSLSSIFETCSKYGLDNQITCEYDDVLNKENIKSDVAKMLSSDDRDAKNIEQMASDLPKQADRYRSIIMGTITRGEKKKAEFKPEYPDILKDRDRVFIEIEDIFPVKEYVDDFCKGISDFIKPYGKKIEMVEVKGNPRINLNGQEIKPIHSFIQSEGLLKSIDKRKLDFKDKELFDVVENGDYAGFKSIIKNRKENEKSEVEPFKNADICRAFDKNELMFYHFGKTLSENRVPNLMMSCEKTIETMLSFYDDKVSKLEYEAGMNSKGTAKPINIIMVSRRPYDIATSSVYDAPEKTCFHPLGTTVNNHFVLEDDIAKGSVVYKGFNKSQMRKVIFRSLGTQYKNDKTGKKIYDYGTPIGERTKEVSEVLNAVNQDLLNDKNAVGEFLPVNKTYVAMFMENAPSIEIKPQEPNLKALKAIQISR